jgi:formate dehydrogenase maturation protein FdhE
MSDAPWTLERVEAERPEIAPLARLHREMAQAVRTLLARRPLPLHPSFAGPPAVHWLEGRALLDASNRAALALPVSVVFETLAAAAARAAPASADAVAEILAAVRSAGFGWTARLVGFSDLPDAGEIPHPALFRFLLMRAVSVPASHLALSVSPPHPQRWLRSACPYCGVPAAAAVARQGSGRTLLCVLCGGRWEREGLDCVACGADPHGETLVLADRRLGPASIEACSACRGSLKVFSAADAGWEPPVALELVTVHLDVLAETEGLGRDATALAAIFPPR